MHVGPTEPHRRRSTEPSRSIPNAMGFFSSNGGAMQLQPDGPNLPNAWIYSTRIVDRAGHPLSSEVVQRTCPTLGVGSHLLEAGGPAR